MTEKTCQELKDIISQLKRENNQLAEEGKNCQNNLQALEMLCAESNKKQLQAEISSMELELIFASVTDAIWVLRDDGIVVRANEAMLRLLGKPAEEVIGQTCSDLLDYSLCHTPNCPRTIATTQLRSEHDIVMQDQQGTPHYYILNTTPLTTIIGTIAIMSQFKDISLRKVAEQKLEEANRTLSRMARLDGLTKIANRRHFDDTLEKEWLRLARSERELSLILIDIDYFKKYNDQYGHQAGDECLIRVAQALQDAILRPGDLAARYGGEEFVLLLPEIGMPGTLHVGKRAARKIAELEIIHAMSDVSPHVSLSMGAATLVPSPQNTPAMLIEAADKALYRAKGQGRNRLIAAL